MRSKLTALTTAIRVSLVFFSLFLLISALLNANDTFVGDVFEAYLISIAVACGAALVGTLFFLCSKRDED